MIPSSVLVRDRQQTFPNAWHKPMWIKRTLMSCWRQLKTAPQNQVLCEFPRTRVLIQTPAVGWRSHGHPKVLNIPSVRCSDNRRSYIHPEVPGTMPFLDRSFTTHLRGRPGHQRGSGCCSGWQLVQGSRDSCKGEYDVTAASGYEALVCRCATVLLFLRP